MKTVSYCSSSYTGWVRSQSSSCSNYITINQQVLSCARYQGILQLINYGIYQWNRNSMELALLSETHSLIQFNTLICTWDFMDLYNNNKTQYLVAMLDSPKKQLKLILHKIQPETYKALRFCLYTVIIFASHMSSAILTQKIYKTPYTPNSQSKHDLSGDYFSNPFGIPLFTGFMGMFYGFVMYEIMQHNSQYREEHQVPQKQFIKLSLVDICITLLLNVAIILTSFTTVNLFNCCNLLSVVIFAVFLSKASDKNRVERRQIVIALLICTGIIIFNVFAEKSLEGANKSLTVSSFLLILFVLGIEGYRPELAAQIRQKHSPPPSLMFYEVSKYNFCFLIIAAAVSTQLWGLAVFIWQHDQLVMDLMLHGILDVVGTIFVYRIIVLHKQHVIPMLTTIRKLFTSIVNITYFKHTVMPLQYLGLGLVGATILLQLFITYRTNSQKFNQVDDSDHAQQPIILH